MWSHPELHLFINVTEDLSPFYLACKDPLDERTSNFDTIVESCGQSYGTLAMYYPFDPISVLNMVSSKVASM